MVIVNIICTKVHQTPVRVSINGSNQTTIEEEKNRYKQYSQD